MINCTSCENCSDSKGCVNCNACSKLGHFVLFADDTNIFVSGKDEKEAYMNANKVLNEVYTYMIINQLHINMAKFVHMHFRPNLSVSDLLTCTRTREYNSKHVLKIGSQKLNKVDKDNF